MQCARYSLRYRLRRTDDGGDVLLLEGEDGRGYVYTQGALQLTLPLAEAMQCLSSLADVGGITRYERDGEWHTLDALRRCDADPIQVTPALTRVAATDPDQVVA